MISIVMPVWNRKKFVVETIRSVLAQTYKDFEFIIVDDGSTDGIREIIEDFAKKDSRIKLIKQKHSGPSDTFNTGFKASKGSAICVLGSDDLWFPNKLERQVEVSKKYPDYILHTKSIRIDTSGNKIGEADTIDTTPEGYRERALGDAFAWFIASSCFIPKKIFDKVGLFTPTLYHDYQWMMRAVLLHNVKMKLIPEYLTMNRTNPDSVTYGIVGGTNMIELGKKVKQSILDRMK